MFEVGGLVLGVRGETLGVRSETLDARVKAGSPSAMIVVVPQYRRGLSLLASLVSRSLPCLA